MGRKAGWPGVFKDTVSSSSVSQVCMELGKVGLEQLHPGQVGRAGSAEGVPGDPAVPEVPSSLHPCLPLTHGMASGSHITFGLFYPRVKKLLDLKCPVGAMQGSPVPSFPVTPQHSHLPLHRAAQPPLGARGTREVAESHLRPTICQPMAQALGWG